MIKENTAIIEENTINADSVKNYDIAAANSAFAFDMYSQMAQLGSEEKKNILFRPFFFRRTAYLLPWQFVMRGLRYYKRADIRYILFLH